MLLQILKWGYIPVSTVIFVLGVVTQAKESTTWGFPALVWLSVGYILLVAISLVIVINLSRENKKLQQPILQQQLSEARKELIRLRKPYENRLEISDILTIMNEQIIIYIKGQLSQTIAKEKWEEISKSVGKIIPKHSVTLLLILPKFQIFANKKWAMSFIARFLVDLTGVFNSYGLGALETEKDEEYGEYADNLKKVKNLEVGLPAKICSQIESSIMVSKVFSTLQLFDLSQLAFKDETFDLPATYVNRFQFLLPTLQLMSSKAIGDIHESIERWLIGE